MRPTPTVLALCVSLAASAALSAPAAAQTPVPAMVEGPNIKVLKDLTVPQFEGEMRHFVQALGVNCGFCHVARNFPSEDNPRKATARRMIEMTKALNQSYFPAHQPPDGASTLGKVTCYTCHQGNQQPKPAPPQ